MVQLPQFSSFAVSGYEMYPGAEGNGISRAFQPGFTLIIGANGLGKTTLLTILRDLAVGPVEISGRGSRREFGSGRFDFTEKSEIATTLRDRVSDRAERAIASLEFVLGARTIAVQRNLSRLEVQELSLDGVPVDATEETFRRLVREAADVPSFADWVFLIDYLVAVREGVATPFWDSNVQRHILRLLVNDRELATALASAERVASAADSSYRNKSTALTSAKGKLTKLRNQAAKRDHAEQQLAHASSRRDDLLEREAQLEEDLALAEASWNDARQGLESMRLEQARVSSNFDAARFQRVNEVLPDGDDVLRFIWSRIGGMGTCLACHREFSREDGGCPLCGRPLDEPTPSPVPDLDELVELEERLTGTKHSIDALAREERELHDRVIDLRRTLGDCSAELALVEDQIADLEERAPAGTKKMQRQEAAVAALSEDLAEIHKARKEADKQLTELLKKHNESVVRAQAGIKGAFDAIASKFLVEECELVPHRSRLLIGQSSRFEVQNFDLQMTAGPDAPSRRRDDHDDVSESQRVFIDIAFRIAVSSVCTSAGGTLLFDAPEGSLDAVFASNAVDTLAEFPKRSPDSRVIVASNLVEGSLLTDMATAAGIDNADHERVIDLIELAAPTAAVASRREDYRRIRDERLVGRGTTS